MGAGIAATLIRAGVSTTMVDVNQGILDSGSARARQLAAGRSKSKAGQADDAESARIASLLSTSTSPAPLADCDVVIEAVTENEAIKTGIFEALAGVLRDEAILASNTSTIPISRMARSWVHPERFAGMHFFHPAQRMELVEVIRGEQTDDQTVTALVDLSRRLGKTPIVVRDCPGFLVTRVLFPYLSQALELLLEGVPMDAIDAAAVQFGMPTGPIALHDFIGLDTVLAISRVMAEGYPDRVQTSPLLVEMVRLGRLGQKSGAGFRKHDRNGPRPAADPAFESLLRQYQHKPMPTAIRPPRKRSRTGSSFPCSSRRSGPWTTASCVIPPTSISASPWASASPPPAAASSPGATARGQGPSWIVRRDISISAPRFTRPLRCLGWPGRRVRFSAEISCDHRHDAPRAWLLSRPAPGGDRWP